MNSVEEKKSHPQPQKESPDLKGTLISVMLLGSFILISWFGVYILFISR
ncbi:cytochrome c oxidase subunit 2A [Virgibacillus byunsanensis]|uniref:Cytochrome c oxidase subunit 2A n=1 Tax=Virgibacillus byunsanensis TaxID=570945 RepID=A0ABW3LJY6_9BACI